MEEGEFNREEFNKYRGKMCHKGTPVIKVKDCYGTYDYYRYYRKKRPCGRKWALDSKTYYKLLRAINNKMIDCLIRDGYLVLPLQLGTLAYRTCEHKVEFKDNKLVTTKLVNWDETLKLWFVDPEARENKTVLLSEDSTFDVVKYEKFSANFHNQDYYEFRIMRPQLRRIKRAKKENRLYGVTFEDPKILNIERLYNG